MIARAFFAACAFVMAVACACAAIVLLASSDPATAFAPFVLALLMAWGVFEIVWGAMAAEECSPRRRGNEPEFVDF